MESQKQLRIGMIGLDTSHVEVFAKILNDPGYEHHIKGGRVTTAYSGGSPDFELSISRVQGYTEKLREEFNVEIVESIAEVAQKVDVVLLTTVDGRKHLEQFAEIAPFGKPTFIDKPLATTSLDAQSIARIAEKHSTPLMSCSGLRFSQALANALNDDSCGDVIGAEFSGPMPLQSTQPGYFWYGIHTVEALYATMDQGCVEVKTLTSTDHDTAIALWKDGRIGIIRGNRCCNKNFYGAVHRQEGSQWVDFSSVTRPNYAFLMDNIMKFFSLQCTPVNFAETLEIVRFIEAVNESRSTGKTVLLGI